MDPLQTAAMMAGRTPVESDTGSSRAERTVGSVQKVSGTATTDSMDGYAFIDLGGSAVTQDDSQAIEIPCDISVKAGDEVAVEIVDGKPRVVGRIGWGDELQTVADDAYSVATATNQHFWEDTNGAHVTEVTQDEFTNPADPNYHSGANSLWNSLGMLFRNGLNNLLAVLAGSTPQTRGIAVYDGLGNESANIVASLTGGGSTVGRTSEGHVSVTKAGLSVYDSQAHEAAKIATVNDPVTGLATVTAVEGVGTLVDGGVTIYVVYVRYNVESVVSAYDYESGTAITATTTNDPNYIEVPSSMNGKLVKVTFTTYDPITAISLGSLSHASGDDSAAFGRSYAYGADSLASGESKAYGLDSHADGASEAVGDYSHSEGLRCKAIGDFSHSEGYEAVASGTDAHAEGYQTTASGSSSHSAGSGTVAASNAQYVIGRYNVSDPSNTYALIVGNGTSDGARSDAMTVAWDGTISAGPVNGFRGRITLATTADIDALFATGIYYIQSGGVGGTLPSGVTGAYGSLICTGSTTEDASTWVGKQMLITGTTIYVRSYSGNPRSWGAWGEHRPYSAPSQTSTLANIISAASNVTISAAYYTTNGIMGQVYITCARSTAIATSAETTLGTIVSGKRPLQQVPGGFSPNGAQQGTVRLLASGDIRIRPTAQIAANTSFTVILPAYMLA